MSLTLGVACFSSFGGSGVVASELATGLARRGHRVHLLASAPPSRPLPACKRLSFHPIRVAEYPLFEHAPYALAAASAMVELARSTKLDLLHVHYAVPHAASAYLARQMLGGQLRVVTSLHGTDVTTVGADPCYREVTRFTVAASDGIVVPSAHLAAEALGLLADEAGLIDAPPIEVIPNFVDTERFAPAAARDPRHFDALFSEGPRGPVLFHVSNFRPIKRTGDLVEVLARVRRAHPHARLVLVGDGPERAATEARFGEAGLRGAVVFLGKQDSFVEHLKHADAFLLPSHTESFGVAALEALSTGVPVFGYRVGGLPELVTPAVGHLVEPHDPAALAEAVGSALASPSTLAALSVAARTRALEQFRIEPALDRYEQYFARVIARTERR